jgi:flagellin-like hook-associated protein FlgL
MTQSVTLSAAMQQNLYALQQISTQQAQTQEILATGKKVNSPVDDPVAYFESQSLSYRASDISNAIANMSQVTQTITAATNALGSIGDILTQMQSVANQAKTSASAGTATATSTNTNTLGASTALVGYKATGAAAAMAAGNKLVIDVGAQAYTYQVKAGDTGATLENWLNSLSGVSASFTTDPSGVSHLQLSSTAGQTISVDQTNSSSSMTALGVTTVSTAGNASLTKATVSLTSGTALNGLTLDGTNNIATGDYYSVQVGSGPTQYFKVGTLASGGNGTTVGDLMSWLNGVSGVSAKFATDANGTQQLQVSSTDGQAIAFGNTDPTGAANPTAATTLGLSNLAAGTTPYDADGSLTAQYNSLLGQLSKLVGDASYNGVNLLGGQNLAVQFSENSSSSMTVQGVQFDPAQANSGLNLSTNLDFQANGLSDIDKALGQITSAQAAVRSQSSTLGSNQAVINTRKDFANQMVATLNTGANDLTQADMNTESANMLALQTQQQLGISSLSMASQAAQSILKLFP